MSIETDIAGFLDEVDAVTPAIVRTPELAPDWAKLLSKLRTNLAAVSLVAAFDGGALAALDGIMDTIRGHGDLDAKLFSVLAALDKFAGERLTTQGPYRAVFHFDDPDARGPA